jgi:3'(2'), 5'-bisphosphate nucleotidase
LHGLWASLTAPLETAKQLAPIVLISTYHLAEAEFARSAVRAGAQLARQIQQDLASKAAPELKPDLSPVTVADYAVQAQIAARLSEAYPGDRLVAEEGAQALRLPEGRGMLTAVLAWLEPSHGPLEDDVVLDWIDRGGSQPAPRFWTLDPVDGTKGFLRGEQYAVALALIEQGEVRLGALACPNLSTAGSAETRGEGSLALAIRGEGAWVEPLGGGSLSRLTVSREAQPVAARVLRSVESGHTDPEAMQGLLELLGISRQPVLMDSQAKYLALAAGAGDLIFRLLSPDRPDYREWIWDQAAGSLLVSEAGGRISDLHGAELDFSQGRRLERNQGVLASNGRLHSAALRALRRALHR